MTNYCVSRGATKYLLPTALIAAVGLFASALRAMDLAITVDDLPIHGSLTADVDQERLVDLFLAGFKKHKIPGVYGFVNAVQLQSRPQSIAVLTKWVEGGHFLGNHTFSHPNLDHPTMTWQAYIRDIQKDEPILWKVMGSKNFHYFRYPYLEEGSTREKHVKVRQFLAQNNYKIAEVTTDFSDWEWNHAYARCLIKHNKEKIAWLKSTYIEEALRSLEIARLLSDYLFHRPAKQIFLMHMGTFEALMLDELLSQFEKQSVQFVSLDEAYNDPIYRIDPLIPFKRSDAYLTQIRLSRRLPTPKAIANLYRQSLEGRVVATCR